ncbi:MAG: type II toxin-antitoxin system HicB family antitoxin [Patescibacteria group bacterium]
MRNIIYIQIYKGEKYYVAEGLNLPVVTQGKTLDEAVANVKEAVELHLSGEDAKAMDFTENPEVLINLELANLQLCQN